MNLNLIWNEETDLKLLNFFFIDLHVKIEPIESKQAINTRI